MTEGNKSGPRTSVLVVDDEPIVLQSLAAWLRQEGHEVDTAEGARKALELAAGRRYEIAFVDIKMPDIDGLELQSRLAAADPELTIIIMTAYASVESAVKALKAGAYDYIPKPFNPEELSHLVRRAIEHRHHQPFPHYRHLDCHAGGARPHCRGLRNGFNSSHKGRFRHR
jgi:DNA-binding NtrC family response regulator